MELSLLPISLFVTAGFDPMQALEKEEEKLHEQAMVAAREAAETAKRRYREGRMVRSSQSPLKSSSAAWFSCASHFSLLSILLSITPGKVWIEHLDLGLEIKV